MTTGYRGDSGGITQLTVVSRHLSRMGRRLRAAGFARVHRSTPINMREVDGLYYFSTNYITSYINLRLQSGQEFPVNKYSLAALRRAVGGW